MIPSDKKIILFPGFERIISEEELAERGEMLEKIEGYFGFMERIVYLTTEDLRKICRQISEGRK